MVTTISLILIIHKAYILRAQNLYRMKKRNILLSVAFMAVAAVAFLFSGNTTATQNNDQLAFQTYEQSFDGKCGTTETKTKEATKAKTKKVDGKSKCGEGKCGEGKAKKDTKVATKTAKDAKAKCGEGKCGEGKATKETKKAAKKEKCGSGKCGDGK